LSPFVKGYRSCSGETGIPRCQSCSIFLGVDFVVDHRKNKNHLIKLSLERESGESVGAYQNVMDVDSINATVLEASYDPAKDDGGNSPDDQESSEHHLELYEDACDFRETTENVYTYGDWTSGSSIDLAFENASYTHQRIVLGANEEALYSAEGSIPTGHSHIGETYLSCVFVSTYPASSLERNSREILEQRGLDWRNWKTVRIAETSVSGEVSVHYL
jgi:hypothetical protein